LSKKKLEEVKGARASDVAERADLEKKLQDSVQNLEAIKVCITSLFPS
jgi:hypothetical protein